MQYDQKGFIKAEDGTSLFYGIRGKEKPALILNDGIGCEGFAWKHLQPLLAEHYTVVHWNYKGHGQSGMPHEESSMNVPCFAKDMVTLLDHLDIDKAFVFGHSMGTQVSLEAYKEAKHRCLGLVLICGSYGRITHTFHDSDVLSRIVPVLIDLIQRHPEIARMVWRGVPGTLAFVFAKLIKELDGLVIQEDDFIRYWENLTMMNPELFMKMLQRAGEHSAADILPHIEAPVLIIGGDRDTFTPLSLSKYMIEQIPNCDSLIIKGGRHTVPVEQPRLISLHIRRFIDEITNKLEPTLPQLSTQQAL